MVLAGVSCPIRLQLSIWERGASSQAPHCAYATGLGSLAPLPVNRPRFELTLWCLCSPQEFARLAHSKVIDLSGFKYVGQDLAPGVAPDTFVYARTAVHRNIFQIPLP